MDGMRDDRRRRRGAGQLESEILAVLRAVLDGGHDRAVILARFVVGLSQEAALRRAAGDQAHAEAAGPAG